MKRKSYFLLAVLLSALLAWLFLSRRASPIPPSAPTPTRPDKTAPTTWKGDDVTAEELAETPWKGTDEQKRDRIAEVREVIKRANQQVRFFGQVIDQDGAPLPGVKVRLSLKRTEETLPGVSRDVLDCIDETSDAQGLFGLTGKSGSLLTVQSLEKSGYEAPYVGNRAYWYEEIVAGRKFTPDEAKPELFCMWKKVGAERLAHADKFYGIVPDGRSYTVDILNGKKIEGGAAGDFKVSIRRPQAVAAGAKYDWGCVIEGIGGGVIETQDEFMYRAPESGYLSHYEVNVSASDPQWSDRAQRRFYLKSRDGRVYARVDVEILANYQDKAVFSVKYFANPSGSRNLEYDPLQDVVPSDRPQSTTTTGKP